VGVDVPKVVPLFPEPGDAPVERERHPWCGHRSGTVDAEARTLTCRECGRAVDPIDFLETLAADWEHHARTRDAIKEETERRGRELKEVKRLLRNAKARLRRAER
jgi:hypothetical protein